jgi:hypothetical protein
MMMRRTRLLTLSMACALGASPLAFHPGQPAADTGLRCDAVLTQAAAAAVVGDAYTGPSVDEPRPGFTRCEWQGDDSNFGFTFANLKAIADDETTLAKAFDIDLQAVESDGKTREALPGIAVNAATVNLGDGAALLEVQRPDGVVRMILYKIDREKMLGLARAIAAATPVP